MVKKATTKPAPDLKQVPEGKVLLIRHIHEGGAICIASGGRGDLADPDIVLARRGEEVVPAFWAKTSRDLRTYLDRGWVEVELVDENYKPKRLPLTTNAPSDIIANLNSNEQRFAMDSIALQEDEALAIAMVDTNVHQPEPRDRMVDNRYMTEKFRYVLDLAAWLEKQIDNRPKVLAAIDEAKVRIRNL